MVQFSSAGAFKFFDIDVKYLEMPLLGNLADIAQEEGVTVVMPMLWHKNKTLITLIAIAIARLLVYIALPCLVSGFRDDQTKFDYLDLIETIKI